MLDAMVLDALHGPPAQRALQSQGVWRDWGWVRGVAESVEARLTESGVGPDQAVGFVPRNTAECAAALLGLIAGRRDVVMIYAYQSMEAIARKLEDLRCAAVVAPAALWGQPVRDAAARLGILGVALEPDAYVVAGTAFDRAAPHRAAAEKPGIGLLTSGTTGPPKIFHMDYDLIHRAMVNESSATQRAIDPATPALHYHPFGNIAGVYGYLPLVAVRQPIIMLEKFSVEGWLKYVREYRPVVSGMPSAGFGMVLDANIPVEDLASIKYMRAGAAPVDPGVHRKFEERYGVTILLSYGATEFGGVVSAMTPEDHAKFGEAKFGSVGRPWAGAQFRVVDQETGAILPPGAQGVLEVQASRMGPHWIHTTDLAVVDEDGFLYHRGRSDGAIMRGGFKIVPEVVVTALQSHPAVSAAAVVGVPDRRLGEIPVAAFELRPGAAAPSHKELEIHLRGILPATHLPVEYRQVEALPRTPSFKLDVLALRQIFLDAAHERGAAGGLS
ncbi:fatty acid--CoA ligase family protein [Phenylobacterium sp.]|jgi:acyl-CoA synthetase (AMP-forming)/AMP-acid ligase II|uniref:class I adenylate-forming enzyme family protein n=1 Tax=Phenylobacterium sp. TaxID=1871053 RepID=UPI002F3EF764